MNYTHEWAATKQIQRGSMYQQARMSHNTYSAIHPYLGLNVPGKDVESM